MERKFSKLSIIEKPAVYVSIMEKFATVVHLGSDDCKVTDWKKIATDVIKAHGSWCFQFQKSKRIITTNTVNRKLCLVQGEALYNFESGEPKSLLKRGKRFTKETLPEEIPKGVPLKRAKIMDVRRLLELHWGETWPEEEKLKFYTDVFEQQKIMETVGCQKGEDEGLDFELLDDDNSPNIA